MPDILDQAIADSGVHQIKKLQSFRVDPLGYVGRTGAFSAHVQSIGGGAGSLGGGGGIGGTPLPFPIPLNGSLIGVRAYPDPQGTPLISSTYTFKVGDELAYAVVVPDWSSPTSVQIAVAPHGSSTYGLGTVHPWTQSFNPSGTGHTYVWDSGKVTSVSGKQYDVYFIVTFLSGRKVKTPISTVTL